MTVLTIGAGIGIIVLLLLLIVIIRFQGCLPEEDEEDQILDEIVTEEIKDMEEIDEDQDPMEWDDSAITVTVNPMEVQNQVGLLYLYSTAVLGSYCRCLQSNDVAASNFCIRCVDQVFDHVLCRILLHRTSSILNKSSEKF